MVRDLAGTTAVVSGASRGFGRATAIALAGLGVQVVGIARSAQALHELGAQLGDRFIPEVADVTDPDLADRILRQYRPQTLVLNAGADPEPRRLAEHTWQTFSENWNVDAHHVFTFLRHALLTPLDPGSVVISVSSGAALNGSPLSGGYAAAKAAVRFLSGYAAQYSEQEGLKLRFVSVLPQITPATNLGRRYTDLYSGAAGISRAEFLDRFGGELSTEQAANSIVQIALDDTVALPAYLLTTRGLAAVP
jgi:NAD(P)-dependent dehydrogenase (short-subunit alcohol dehydrogenase family)